MNNEISKIITIGQKTIEIRRAFLSEVIQLRHDILIVGTDRTSPEFDGDNNASTRHFGAFFDKINICCLSWMRSELDGAPAWQLRGMATHPEVRGTGVGRALLFYSEESITAESGISTYWCNARTTAAVFYQKQGWSIISDEFHIPGVGPHFKMKK